MGHDLANELRRAIEVRGNSIAEQVGTLHGTLATDRQSLIDALELVEFFPPALEQVVNTEWNHNPDANSRVQILRPLLLHATTVASFVEEWLSHGERQDLSHYLTAAIEREAELLGIGKRHAVLAHGSANNFLTFSRDFENALLGPLGPRCPNLPQQIQGRQFAMIRVPRFEGSDPHWLPILIGHEVAHLAVVHYDTLKDFDLFGKFDFREADSIPFPFQAPAGTGLALYQIATSWAIELLCDARAVHRFGPAAVASLAEFLEKIGATEKYSTTHPPGRFRVALLLHHLGEVAEPRISAVLKPWSELVDEGDGFEEQWVDYLATFFMALAAELSAAVDAWPSGRYAHDRRSEIILTQADQFGEGIPGGRTHNVVNPPEIRDADIVNACWVARSDRAETPVDRLGVKALETLDLLRRWRAAGGTGTQSPDDEMGTRWSMHGRPKGVLSAIEIRRRLTERRAHRLVVTPLFDQSLAGVGLDVHLGNRFIVFIRSRVPSFDPILLQKSSDPRRMQRLVEVGWGSRFVLHPNELVLAATVEYLVIPKDLTAQLITRSSYGRLGLLSATAIQVHPYFRGCLTLELVNLGTVPLELVPGERVAQLVFSTVVSPPPVPQTKYNFPTGPEFSRIRSDPEAEVLRQLSDTH